MEITSSQIIAKLKLKPNPEGGFYRETFRDDSMILSVSQLPSHCDVLSFTLFSHIFIINYTYSISFLNFGTNMMRIK